MKLVKVYALRASTTDGMATPSAGAVVSDSVAANGTTEVVTEPLASTVTHKAALPTGVRRGVSLLCWVSVVPMMLWWRAARRWPSGQS